jgi:hypothetical protein
VVDAVVAAWHAPLYGELRHIPVIPEGGKEAIAAGYNFVSAEYFSIFRIPLVQGRGFSTQEAGSEFPVVIVSQATARRFWPGQDALGRWIAIPPQIARVKRFDRTPGYATARVIGVAKDVINGAIANGPEPTCLYFPTNPSKTGNDSLLVRVKGDDAAARRQVEAAMNRIAPSIADQIIPMDDVFASQFFPFRVMFWLSAFLGLLALVLTASGIYGVISYLVSQRTREIGIRVALGADVRAVVAMVVKQSMRLAAIGTLAGVLFTLMVAPVFAHQLPAIDPYDLVAYGGGVLLVLATVLAASFYPSRRAMRIDPAVTLRCD